MPSMISLRSHAVTTLAFVPSRCTFAIVVKLHHSALELTLLVLLEQSDALLLMPTIPDLPSKLDTKAEKLEVFRNRTLDLICVSGMSGCCQVVPSHLHPAIFRASLEVG